MVPVPYKSKADLPAQVKVLPSEAQSIFMKAFNAAYEEYGEERAFKISWGAVRNAGYSKKGEQWVKTKDHSYEVIEYMVLDASDLKITQDNYLVATPRVARTGIQLYKGFELGRDDMDVIRVYRPDSEVFAAKAFSSFAHRPVTVEHPPEFVTADNWKRYAVGQTDGDVVRDGQFVRVPMMLMDAKAIDEVKSGRKQLSAGYSMMLDWGEGTTPEGETYDAVQADIRTNHIAVTKAARGGSQLRIGDAYLGELPDANQRGSRGDLSMPHTILVRDHQVQVESEDAAKVVLKAIKDADDRITALDAQIKSLQSDLEAAGKAKASVDAVVAQKDKEMADSKVVVAAKDSEIDNLKQQLNDNQLSPQKLDLIVKERAEIIGKSKRILGDKLAVDGKTNTEIMRQVVDARMGTTAKTYTDEHVRIAFDTINATAPAADALADALSRRKVSPAYSSDARQEAQDKRSKMLENAWQNPSGAARQ